jgi:hypothetical protein
MATLETIRSKLADKEKNKEENKVTANWGGEQG